MSHMPHIPYLMELLVFLVTAVVVVPVCRLLRISPIIGFLVVGILGGPHVLALVTDVDQVNALAELGVVFLLFTIGLELSLQRLWQMRRSVFGLGLLQVGICGAVLATAGWQLGLPGDTSLLIGLSLALSSTAIVVQLLVERGQIASREGRLGFSVLLFQDLMVVPLLFLVNALSRESGANAWLDLIIALGEAVLAIAVIVVVGRLILRPLFRLIANLGSPEIFVALSLLVLLGTAVATALVGLSMALGAFLAGLLLAETEFRHQIEIDIQPFKGLLLGLFFIAIGLRLDITLLASGAATIALVVAGLYGVKALLITGIARVTGLPLAVGARLGLMLGQGGEFAFVILTAALAAGLVADDIAQFTMLAVGLTMLLTPALSKLGEMLQDRFTKPLDVSHMMAGEADLKDLEDHVIIAGYGRVGRMVSELLESQKVSYVALDLNTASIAGHRKEGRPVFYGDSSRKDALERVGINRASLLVVTLDDPNAARRTLGTATAHWPELEIYVRAKDSTEAEVLTGIGACHAVPETVESSLQLGAEVLVAMGIPTEAVSPVVEEFRQTTYARLRRPRDAA